MSVIDARPSDSSKTSTDRQRFVRRARNQIREAVKQASATGDIRSLAKGRIRVPVKDMNEPEFVHDQKTGTKDRVFTGNEKFIPGDRISKPQGGQGQGNGAASDSGEGEDDFSFMLTPEEFYEFLFEDLELPDLLKRNLKQVTQVQRKRAGFVTSGNPCQLDVRQTYKYAYARHKALGRPSEAEIQQAREDLEEAQRCSGSTYDIEFKESILNELLAKQKSIPLIDDMDLRYRNYPPKPEPITKALMICVMDVSGSMDEQRKDIAKRFFLLLYVWLLKQYDSKVELVFIRHHSEAEEVDEHKFFYDHESGGTLVSPALELASDVISSRYPTSEWNIYMAQASDGDNWFADNVKVTQALTTLMPKLQYLAYLQVAETPDYPSSPDGLPQTLWQVYREAMSVYPHLQQVMADEPAMVWPVFQKLFAKAT